MAQLYPDFYTIQHLHQPATEGELALLDFLQKNLNPEFEIYFQPFINGDRPDIVILKKNGGAIIIEVKDWNLENYYIDEHTNWHLYKNDCPILSPLSQVKKYRDNIIDLHIDTLLSKTLNNWYYRNTISTIVYFHNESEQQITNFLLEQFEDREDLPQDTKNRYKRYRNFIKYIECWGKDSQTFKKLYNYLEKIRLNKPSILFDESLYLSFKRYLLPPYHQIEEGKTIVYSKEQTELIRSESNPRRKIKGIAGSGKTLVLARRAVNAYLRTESTILILTYNLSLKNYIHDRINDVRENYPWDKFYITNYHQFFKAEANNYGLEVKSLLPFIDTKFFEPVKRQIKRYKVILIDEVQDYKTEWLEIIHTYFLEENGEFVVFGDEKQNIYNRPLDDDKEPKTIGIKGKWNKSLNTSRRFTNKIGRLAMSFQHYFLEQKYTIDEMQILENPTLNFEQEHIKYANIGANSNALSIYKIYVGSVRKFNIHPSDVTFLSSKIEILRDIEYHINTQLKENTTTTFETKEEYEKCKASYQENDLEFKTKIENIRRNKKNHFWMKTGTVKLSSIHSYKGWESHTVILIIEPEDKSNSNNESVELIYTAITRAQVNLFILNMGNEKYDSFFKDNISN